MAYQQLPARQARIGSGGSPLNDHFLQYGNIEKHPVEFFHGVFKIYDYFRIFIAPVGQA